MSHSLLSGPLYGLRGIGRSTSRVKSHVGRPFLCLLRRPLHVGLHCSVYFQAGSTFGSKAQTPALRGTTAFMAFTQAPEFPHKVQQPAPGRFTLDQLELAAAQRSNPYQPGEQLTAHYDFIATGRVPDSLKSYEDPGVSIQTNHTKTAADVKRPETNSWIHKLHLHCSYGPKDQHQQSQKLKPKAADTTDSDKKPRRHLVDLGDSRKRGCTAGFSITRLLLWPDICEVSFFSLEHVDSTGQPCHGPAAPTAAGTKHAYAAWLSPGLQDWIIAELRSGANAR